jgi:hypothetical protein
MLRILVFMLTQPQPTITNAIKTGKSEIICNSNGRMFLEVRCKNDVTSKHNLKPFSDLKTLTSTLEINKKVKRLQQWV